MRRNQESMCAGEQATHPEREENVEAHKSRVKETLKSGEISEMGETWKEIRMLRQQVVSRAPVPKRGSPFSLAILEEGLPPNFRQSNVGEYDGHADPEEHLGRLRMRLCCTSIQTESGAGCFWPKSIQSFEDFSAAFLHRFASSKRHQKNYLSLFVMKQQEAETLREFVQRFNSAALEIPAAAPDIMISAFTQGLREGEFFKSLVKKPASSYDDLLARAEKYVNMEDAQRYKRMENRPGGSRAEGAVRCGRKRGAGEREEDRARGRGQFSSHVPLNRSRDKVMEVRESGEREGKSQRVESEVEALRGKIRWSKSRGEKVEVRMSLGSMLNRGGERMRIPGGATDGDSGQARKAHGRRLENFEISRGADLPQDPVISFGTEDLRGVVAPHNDALVVTATVANYDVARIFIDNGSSVNILFKSTLDQMKVEGFEFEPISTPLYGFAGHAIPPLGQIVLPLSLEHGPRRVTKMTTFAVVDTLPLSLGHAQGKALKRPWNAYHLRKYYS
ncbi:uncharacterized protein [Primulina huaijiensis]|uniref:uncharacterized protein n=1 Tax=Primulina huaijiensis TaxID=1492673 RepID=UPI003CC78D07